MLPSEERGLVLIGAILLILVGAPLGIVLDGWALSLLWRWFVAEPFALPAVSIPVAIGVALLIRCATHAKDGFGDDEDDDDTPAQKLLRAVSYVILRPLFTVGFGWVVTLFM